MNSAVRTRPSLIGNAFANWGAFLYVAAIGFFLSPIVVNSLGSTAYGVWSLLVTVVGYLGLLDFGVRGAVTRYIAHHHAAADHESSSLIATAAIVLFGAMGVLAILISCGLSWLAPVAFHIPAELLPEAQTVTVKPDGTVLVNGRPRGRAEDEADLRPVGTLSSLPGEQTATGPLGPMEFLSTLRESEVVLWKSETITGPSERAWRAPGIGQ